MATQHDDGSVTLTAAEFRSCATHLEMSSAELLDFLSDRPDGFTTEELIKTVMQRIELEHMPTDTPAN